ncbi:hypothetical protein EVG20_g1541 [Dentipellis fragilis]|uniref:F-box domain-containing protein n=1 Tax=Dentipellis fragilis TaxID=205917 RepID=A0A4Y9ZAJ8_9AGAM|nr:hypothetical protein EVG20_g1541 [Dentipellis fragilis]
MIDLIANNIAFLTISLFFSVAHARKLEDTMRSLPAELQVKIFECLDHIHDLLNCSVVCKFFYVVVRDSITLQYRIQLAIDGVSETEDASEDSIEVERLRILLDRRRRWSTLSPLKKSTITFPSHRPWSYSDGVLCYVRDNHLLHYVITVVQLPSLSGGGSSYDIWITGLSSVPLALTHDPTQDLLALLTVTPIPASFDKHAVFIEMRSLRTGEKIRSPGLTPLCFIRENTMNPELHRPRIFQDYLAVLSQKNDGPVTYSATDFAFLTPKILLLAQPDRSGQIEVLTPRQFLQDSPQHHHGFVHLLSLQLPRRSPNFYLDTMTITCEPTPASLEQCSFSDAAVNAGIISVACAVLDYRHGSRIVNFVFHARTIFRALAAHNLLSPAIHIPKKAIAVPWSEWGPDACRGFLIDPWMEDICAIYGTRVVLGRRDSEDDPLPRGPQVFDFNVHRHMTVAAPDPPHAELVTAPTLLLEEPGFEDPVETALPYAAIDIPNADAYCGYRLDGQRLLAMKPRPDDDDAEQEVDVFVF